MIHGMIPCWLFLDYHMTNMNPSTIMVHVSLMPFFDRGSVNALLLGLLFRFLDRLLGSLKIIPKGLWIIDADLHK